MTGNFAIVVVAVAKHQGNVALLQKPLVVENHVLVDYRKLHLAITRLAHYQFNLAVQQLGLSGDHVPPHVDLAIRFDGGLMSRRLWEGLVAPLLLVRVVVARLLEVPVISRTANCRNGQNGFHVQRPALAV